MDTTVAVRTSRFADWRARHQSGIEEARHNLHVFLRDKLAVAGLIVIVATVVVAVFAAYLAPYPEQGRGDSDMANRLQPPSAENIMGTDQQGRDVLSRVMFGARIPLVISVVVTAGVLLVGVPLGGIAGYFGGWIDEAVMRITDIFLAFPALVFAMALVAFLGASLRNVALALVITWWPWYARLVRGMAISLRERPYVLAAKTMGVSHFTIIRRHILPNAFGPVIVQMTVDVGAVILEVAALSFIGLGAKPPTPEWGLMISEGRQYILSAWWLSTFAGIAVFGLVLAYNLVGDALRDILDPRLKR
ncbi:MAG: ABC transporter permease [Thermoleophilia bacterium]|nr:ABC transporter permease [Thermoleophilia bacterium]